MSVGLGSSSPAPFACFTETTHDVPYTPCKLLCVQTRVLLDHPKTVPGVAFPKDNVQQSYNRQCVTQLLSRLKRLETLHLTLLAYVALSLSDG